MKNLFFFFKKKEIVFFFVIIIIGDVISLERREVMGRYVGNGLATTIAVNSRYREYDILSHKKEILASIGKLINLDLYDVSLYENGFDLHLKVDLINEHLKDLLREVSFNERHINVLSDSYEYQELDKLDDFWNSDFSVEVNKSNHYVLKANGHELSKEEYLLAECFNQVYLRDCEGDQFIFISVCIIPLGMDCDKIVVEDETYLLYLLNMDLKRYQNPLSTAFVYAIIG